MLRLAFIEPSLMLPHAALRGKVDGTVIACDGSSVFPGKRDVIVLWKERLERDLNVRLAGRPVRLSLAEFP